LAKILYGERIGRTAKLAPGCSGVVFDDTRQKVLLMRRTDNNQWCLPGGAMDAGESVAECCTREVWEETGLRAEVVRLIGVYSSPHRINTYADGNRWQVVSLVFEVKVIGGELTLNEEASDLQYFSQSEIAEIDLLESHRERITDIFMNATVPYLK
jgi:ADP-ribose pyrophosphatase YjhB (NUDIX family)